MKNSRAVLILACLLGGANLAFADGNVSRNENINGYNPDNSNISANENTGNFGQTQFNDGHPTSNASQTAIGGQIVSSGKSWNTVGAPANAIRNGDCAGDAEGISLYSFLGGVGYSKSSESRTCRINQTIALTCDNAQGYIRSGAAMVKDSDTSVSAAGKHLLRLAINMAELCMNGLQRNPINVELAAATAGSDKAKPAEKSRPRQKPTSVWDTDDRQ
ncbi:MAG: hypothetical protein C0473_00260 [Cyanobacteria bacterium DS3.002]|nr:hypothetical protein [Cyanobacteria bacterium DS3.002]MBA4049417.1 hypothetical protein [Cyanobacteria bacterium DS2.008]MBA4077360.1 hypothetical protein [Cyanobacteria bacterium PR.023]